mmetsp:Transcript_26178/g.43811  ORF Transcript_26178/g.43811 Transcript_26178/m.43811 type:complete len:398 (-) Transcript_26178:365-1558(-)|eukprot:CAMPEP_0198211692 /NCGR_PEP_ID=MMETSP1445-20131203/25141_1 /TAXON_ID=36898 /ORGANISM="Pyramimonas sp., Strain CCMP2087" /LENGTH=397 /DNA_ID=CAMNT_0043886013 /DNA_START=106 /DNA_END=1299 /DNA_ORIENTATION=-
MARACIFLLGSLATVVASYSFDDELTSISDVLSEHNARDIFQQWREHHTIGYSSDEEHESRFQYFHSVMRDVHAHNSRTDSSYKQGINRLADLTPEEAAKRLGGHNPAGYVDHGAPDTIPGESWESSCGFTAATADISKGIDWRDKGVLSPVKNQGACGSCWAYSTTAAVEAIMAITGDPVTLSEQELTDCSQLSNHCDSGNLEEGYKWVIANGLGTIEQYPYNNALHTNETCAVKNAFTHRGFVDSYEMVPRGERNLKKAMTLSPVSVAIDAFQKSFMSYKSGLYDGPCATKIENLGHAVAAVGFGWDDDVPYIVIRNSWTAEWGESGYIRLKANADAAGWSEYSGACGTALLMVRPIKDGSTQYHATGKWPQWAKDKDPTKLDKSQEELSSVNIV